MKRSDFLKAAGAAVALPAVGAPLWAKGTPASHSVPSNCILIPSETAGPFPLDLTANEFFFRQDIREESMGVQLRQKVRIIGADNCAPMPNVRVNIWHCDRDGNYSGYGTETGLTYCRGYQITDENGECEFITIVPGWYPGRVTHVHFQVFVSTAYSAVSQWTWPHDAVVDAINAHADLYPAGPDPLTPGQDGVFADGYDLQMATLSWDEAAGEYVSEFEATVQGTGTVGVGYEEMRTAQVIHVGDIYPNPSADWIHVPFELFRPMDVSWSLWNAQGRIIAEQSMGRHGVGANALDIDLNRLNCAPGSYVLQLLVNDDNHRFVQVRQVSKRP